MDGILRVEGLHLVGQELAQGVEDETSNAERVLAIQLLHNAVWRKTESRSSHSYSNHLYDFQTNLVKNG